MTRDVTTVRSDTPIGEAIATMVGSHLSGLPVLNEQGRLAGILTEGDLLRRSEIGTVQQRPGWLHFLRGPSLAVADCVHRRTLHVADVMTPAPVTVAGDATLDKVVAMMEHSRIKRVPVVEGGTLVGIVSRGDLVRALGRVLEAARVE